MMLPEPKERISNAKALLFDFDGTLVDLEKLNFFAFEQVMERNFGVKIELELYRESAAGCRSSVAFSNMISKLQIESSVDPSQLTTQFRQVKRDSIEQNPGEHLRLIDGVKEFLTSVAGEQPIYIVSSTSSQFLQLILGHFQLLDYFEHMISSEDVRKGKPDPEPYLMALERLGITASQAVAFEDSKNGLRSAKAAQLYTIGIRNNGWNDQFVGQLSDFVIDDYRSLL